MTWPTEIWIVVWEDPTTHISWASLKKAKGRRPVPVISIGWGLAENGNNYHLVMDWSSDKGVNGIGIIPKRAVVRRFRVPIPKLLGPFLKKFLG